MKKPLLFLLIVAAAALCILGAWKIFFAQARPNILLITLDTTRADRLGCYGYALPTSPNIDELAAEGVRFDMAIAQAAVTPVSHASILTGLNPFEHGLRVLYGATNYRLEEGDCPTLATILSDEGWATGAFVSSFPVSEFFGLHHGFDLFDTGISGDVEEKMIVDNEKKASWKVNENQRRADVTTDEAIAWLEEVDDPFFMWLHFFDPHDSSVLPPREIMEGIFLKFCPNPMAVSSEERSRALYDAEIFFKDQQLGRLFDHLKETGQYDNTIIVLTNDHGEGLGDHDWWFHRILYQEQIRMPLIVRLPEGPRGTVVADTVRSIDIMPTILDEVGVEIPSISGETLSGLMAGETEGDRIAYADALIRLDDNRPKHAESEDNIYNDLMYTVIKGPWKLIYHRYHEEASMLFRLDEDPREENNVIDRFPEIRDELMKILRTEGIMIEKLIPRAPDSDASDRLNKLGYGAGGNTKPKEKQNAEEEDD